MSKAPQRRWGPVRSLLCLAPLFILAPIYSYRAHYALPNPVVDLVDPATSLPQASEARILAHAKYLSEDIGYRTVGTKEHALGDAWVLQQAEALRAECESIVLAHPERKLECEVWHQQGSGSHRFDMMGRRLYKTYVNLTNIIVRVSDGTEEGKEHAVLVNSHVDSTLPSPGAADDGLSVGVMLESIRVLVNTPAWEPKHAIVFLFNNAEESLQDGSHLFSTQHPVAKTIRAAINLEAAGTTGPEILFQATSEQMIEAYSKVPRPYGSVIANEIFSSGIILSDTDFRQFELYLNVSGLDMAVVGNSYLYHMRKDLVENIETGVAQHMAENVLALLLHLTAEGSPLPELAGGYTRPHTVFYEYFGFFLAYSFTTAKILYSTFLVIAFVVARATYVDPTPALKNGTSFFGEQIKGFAAVSASFVGAVVGANVVALLMDKVLGKSFSWFSSEFACVVLYGPAALTGALVSQLLVPRVREQTAFTSVMLMQSFLATVLQLIGIGSGGTLFLSSAPFAVALLVNGFLTKRGDDISLWSYAIGLLSPLVIGTTLFCGVLEVFVPLTGRIGEEAPAEHIIAIIVSATGSFTLSLTVPFMSRFSHRTLVRSVTLLTMITGLTMAVFSMRSPFDSMHQKRLFVIHMENITSEEQHLHIAAADGAPGFHSLAADIAKAFSTPDVTPTSVVMNDWNSDWDTVYPFSAFLTPYKFDLPLRAEHQNPIDHDFTVTAINNKVDEVAGTRSFTLVVNHPAIIWTSIAFDAHVIEWTLDNNPPDEFARHHIKEGSFYGYDTWTVDLVTKLRPDAAGAPADGSVKVNFVGIHEKAMWPGKKAEKALGGRAMALFEEFDGWLERETGGTVDAMFLGCVAGVAVI
ncbi:uncharacterized protein TRAVEDRAFT_28892 [Trametes versicolor FP-101664 SS1]|uniref:uncharacterized protein n=1 Tax=Trametes versicolor (strain FP-101664) TaxID=717944 RepID=UPI0004623673|nr:uncharacterized protein TRAVEDRAFT_28892 [Trametes versicolor FP-101664 SS1]EIW58152.1 hypothetical protein TRAVEDRAFT_28892 [Trametes versicolor FP-101664 SS1]